MVEYRTKPAPSSESILFEIRLVRCVSVLDILLLVIDLIVLTVTKRELQLLPVLLFENKNENKKSFFLTSHLTNLLKSFLLFPTQQARAQAVLLHPLLLNFARSGRGRPEVLVMSLSLDGVCAFQISCARELFE